jgi:hypothetical protein
MVVGRAYGVTHLEEISQDGDAARFVSHCRQKLVYIRGHINILLDFILPRNLGGLTE